MNGFQETSKKADQVLHYYQCYSAASAVYVEFLSICAVRNIENASLVSKRG